MILWIWSTWYTLCDSSCGGSGDSHYLKIQFSDYAGHNYDDLFCTHRSVLCYHCTFGDCNHRRLGRVDRSSASRWTDFCRLDRTNSYHLSVDRRTELDQLDSGGMASLSRNGLIASLCPAIGYRAVHVGFEVVRIFAVDKQRSAHWSWANPLGAGERWKAGDFFEPKISFKRKF